MSMSPPRPITVNIYASTTKLRKTRYFTITVGKYTYTFDAGTVMRFAMEPTEFARYLNANLIQTISAGTTTYDDLNVRRCTLIYLHSSDRTFGYPFSLKRKDRHGYSFTKYMLRNLKITCRRKESRRLDNALKSQNRKARFEAKLLAIVDAYMKPLSWLDDLLMYSLEHRSDKERRAIAIAIPYTWPFLIFQAYKRLQSERSDRDLGPYDEILSKSIYNSRPKKYTLNMELGQQGEASANITQKKTFSRLTVLHHLLRSGFFVECHKIRLNRVFRSIIQPSAEVRMIEVADSLWALKALHYVAYKECRHCSLGEDYLDLEAGTCPCLNKAASTIQRRWLDMYYNPERRICQARLRRDYEEYHAKMVMHTGRS